MTRKLAFRQHTSANSIESVESIERFALTQAALLALLQLDMVGHEMTSLKSYESTNSRG